MLRDQELASWQMESLSTLLEQTTTMFLPSLNILFCICTTAQLLSFIVYKFMVNSVLDDAKSMGLSVIRIWAMVDIGSNDGSRENIDGVKDCMYFPPQPR